MNKPYHIPVLVNEVLQYLAPKPGELYVDATFGGGGHSRAILQKEPLCRVIAIDIDRDALAFHEETFKKEFGDRIEFIWGNFAQLSLLLRKHGVQKVDGILADFGTSQHQIFAERGFSFLGDSPLDMRMSSAHHKVSAAQILNRAPERELVRIFKEYGEEPHARLIARAIIAQREKELFRTTGQLAQLVERFVPRRGSHTHPATKVFQALRIAVNHELESIEHFLPQTLQVLKPGGRLVCISFHSLEDRLVKQFLRAHQARSCASIHLLEDSQILPASLINELRRTGSTNGKKPFALSVLRSFSEEGCIEGAAESRVPGFELLTQKVVQAGEEELRTNPASRSAKLRAARFLTD